MRKIVILLLLLFINVPMFIHARHVSGVQKEIDDIKDGFKSMITVITYDKEGKLLHSGNGFYISKNGTGIASFSLFEGAHKAIVVNYKGKESQVARILGASNTYDLVKFSTQTEDETDCLPLAANPVTDTGTPLHLIRYSGKKKSTPVTTSIKKSEDFEGFKYLHVELANNEKDLGCPLLNGNGELVAIIQKNVTDSAKEACAIDARFCNKINISSTSILDADLRSIEIPKGLPETEKDALTLIYMLGYKDSILAINAANDFIEQYPDNAEGYVNRASFYASKQLYDLCENDFKTALEKAGNEKSTMSADEIHNNFSKLIYNKVLYSPEPKAENWTLDRAIEEAQLAYEISPSPYYLLQQANCYYGKKDFTKAYDNYIKINTTTFQDQQTWSPQATAETWILAARSFEQSLKQRNDSITKADSVHIIALIDSALQVFPQPFGPNEARFILERAQRYEQIKEFRKAVMDYNEYEKIIGPKNLNDKFYYIREQAELKCGMYQQALDDIRTAIAFNPKDPFYPVEEAIVLLNASMYKEAITACEKSLQKIPNNPDCYKIMGIAYGELKNKEKAMEYLQKAKQLGDTSVDTFMKKYE